MKMYWRWVVPAMLLAALLAGCSGGDDFTDFGVGTGRLDSGDRQLPDDSFIEFRTFEADAAGTILIAMRSAGTDPLFDPFLWVFPGEVDTVAEAVDRINADDFIADDDSGDGLDAEILLAVDRGEVFTVGFNSLDDGDTGTYQYIVDYLANVTAAQAGAEAGDKPNDREVARAKAQAK